jgi:hypothetical protein
MNLPTGQRRSNGNAVLLLLEGTACDLPAFNFLYGYGFKLGLRLPVGIQLAEEINKDASPNDWKCQSQNQACQNRE